MKHHHVKKYFISCLCLFSSWNKIMMFCLLERGTEGAAWIPVSVEYCYFFSNTCFLYFQLFPEGNNIWKFAQFITLNTKKFSASRMSRNQSWGGWQPALFLTCYQQRAFGVACFTTSKTFLSYIHTHSLLCPQAKDRWMTPISFPTGYRWEDARPFG